MKKISKNKKLLFVLVMLICLFSAIQFVSAHGSADYHLSSYDLNILVNENNTLEITEKIGAFFNVPKHGIYRKIPLRNKITRLDGTTSYNRAKISEIAVSENYKTYHEDGCQVIKIGDADHTLTGAKEYTLKYRYNLGPDTGKNYDEFYLNLIGNEWDTTIANVTFTMIMPKEFEKEKLGFSSGWRGSTNSANISYQVKGKVITGKYLGILEAGEALTVRLELPEGYFVGASKGIDLITILALILPIIFLFITFYLWKKYGKDNQVVETVEFYLPAGLNSAEVGFLYKGKADTNDVISLLVYLANKGYLKIEEFEQKLSFSKKKKFKLVKVKDYDGDNESERMFLQGLFKRKAEVTESDLYNKFYITLGEIIDKINCQKNKHEIFEKASLVIKIAVILLIVIVYMLITIKPVLEYNGTSELIYASIFPVAGFYLFISLVLGKTSFLQKISGLLIGVVLIGVPWFSMVLPALEVDPLYSRVYLIGFVSILLMLFLYKVMPKRTPYGNEMLGKIKGFKTFLETVEKPKLETLVMEDPSYFYNILPYTYVLGVSDKWIKKFETIAIKAPDWYGGNSEFDMETFGKFMNSTMASATDAMSSSPGTSGTGGGSAGRGSGGGGGGSW